MGCIGESEVTRDENGVDRWIGGREMRGER
jgi:hypothetical protein